MYVLCAHWSVALLKLRLDGTVCHVLHMAWTVTWLSRDSWASVISRVYILCVSFINACANTCRLLLKLNRTEIEVHTRWFYNWEWKLKWKFKLNCPIQNNNWNIDVFWSERCLLWLVQQLVEAVQRFGTANWMKVAEYMPGRTSLQCRERWDAAGSQWWLDAAGSHQQWVVIWRHKYSCCAVTGQLHLHFLWTYLSCWNGPNHHRLLTVCSLGGVSSALVTVCSLGASHPP